MTPQRRAKCRNVVKKIHLWLGIGVALYFVFQSVTGLLLVYRHEIERLSSYPSEVPSNPIAVQTIIDKLEQYYPSHQIDRIHFPATAGEPYFAHLTAPDHAAEIIVEVNAYSGAPQQAGTLVKALAILFDLHHDLSLGKPGKYIAGMAGLILLASSITGIWLWWPGFRRLARTFKLKLGVNPQRTLHELHRLTGSVFFVFILVSTTTGVVMAYGGPLRSLFEIKSNPTLPFTPEHGRQPLSADRLLFAAKNAAPNPTIRDIRFTTPDNLLTTVVFFRGSEGRSGPYHRVWVDPYTGAIRGVVNSWDLDAGNMFFAWMYPIHTQFGLGSVGKALVTAGGIGVLFLSVTGPLLWWRKRSIRVVRANSGNLEQTNPPGFDRRQSSVAID